MMLVPVLSQALAWTSTGSMATARHYHTATLLDSGKVLVAGGVPASSAYTGTWLASAELYDPATGTWSATGSLATSRTDHTATLLPSGKVLVVGGSTRDYTGDHVLASAELYDPATETWTGTGSLVTARCVHTATLLKSGKVLVVGGWSPGVVANVELYDPATGTWSATGSLVMAQAHWGDTATLLDSGQVLIAGGHEFDGTNDGAELYDPATETWSVTGSTYRAYHTATLLKSGMVLVSGGSPFASSELYDPATGTWTRTGSLAADEPIWHTATLLNSGRVLVVGGWGAGALASAELYDKNSGTWSDAGVLAQARRFHTATLLLTGHVLVAGGYNDVDGVLASAELR